MKPTLSLFLDMELTSLSPDAQPISIGIVAGTLPQTSFYAEFTDFDLARCDDWVRENVVGKLIGENIREWTQRNNPRWHTVYNDTAIIKTELLYFLSQFSDYNLQFIVDCGTWDWWFFMQLVAEWEEVYLAKTHVPHNALQTNIERHVDLPGVLGHEVKDLSLGWHEITYVVNDSFPNKDLLNFKHLPKTRIGLPKLPDNISPIPFDLNDLIAIKKGITPGEAFDLNREEMAFSESSMSVNKHNALWDAKVIRENYNKLM